MRRSPRCSPTPRSPGSPRSPSRCRPASRPPGAEVRRPPPAPGELRGRRRRRHLPGHRGGADGRPRGAHRGARVRRGPRRPGPRHRAGGTPPACPRGRQRAKSGALGPRPKLISKRSEVEQICQQNRESRHHRLTVERARFGQVTGRVAV